ncbi:glutathione peroxidase [Crocinitomix sp.]|nr:glutathione peroxidase [Crocinitomix sp.]
MTNRNFYSLKFKLPNGSEYPVESLKGKTILVVNTATKCGLTPQFEGLEKLHNTYKDKGLVVLGFPCNQFGSQEPETNETMEEVCAINHGVTFQLLEKIDVNGPKEHAVFTWLKAKTKHFLFGSKIKWNFTKFLIASDGNKVVRFAPITKLEKMESEIQKMLKK